MILYSDMDIKYDDILLDIDYYCMGCQKNFI